MIKIHELIEKYVDKTYLMNEANWTDVKTEQPEIGKSVLIRTEDNIGFGELKLENGYKQWFCSGYIHIYNVLYWMPIPKQLIEHLNELEG